METDYSKNALMKFLDYIIEKGLVNTETGKGWRVATSKFLVDLTSSEEADVRSIDIELAARKFANRQGANYTPASLNSYRSRVANAIQEFTSYANNPASYKPRNLNGRTRKNEQKPRSASPVSAPVAMSNTSTSEAVLKEGSVTLSGLSLPYPIRTDFLAQVVVPRDMTVEEAKRLGAFLLTLAVDFKPGEG